MKAFYPSFLCAVVKVWPYLSFHRREQAVEKKYPGTYKRHPVRPIIHPNAMEKLMKRKGVPHKPGMQTKR